MVAGVRVRQAESRAGVSFTDPESVVQKTREFVNPWAAEDGGVEQEEVQHLCHTSYPLVTTSVVHGVGFLAVQKYTPRYVCL